MGERVAVLDMVGFHQATSTVELLAERGANVEVFTTSLTVGQDLGLTLDWENWHRRVLARGVRLTTSVAPLGVEGGVITAVHAYSGEMVSFGPFDTVVVADHGRADDDLYHALRAAKAGNAIVEGHRVGRAL